MNPNYSYLHICFPWYYQHVLKYSYHRDQKNLEDITLHSIGNSDLRHELLNLYDVITEQNYFLNNNNIRHPKRWPCNGHSFLQHIVQNFHTTCRAYTSFSINTQTQIHKLLPICWWHPSDLWLITYRHTHFTWWLQFYTSKPKIHRRSRTKQSP